MSDFLRKRNTRVNFLGSGKSPEEYLASRKEYSTDFVSKTKEERIQEDFERIIRFRRTYNLSPLDKDEVDSIRQNINQRYDDCLQTLNASVEEWYDTHNSQTCNITNKKIPYDTDYFILNIKHSDGYDHDFVLSVDGLKQLCNSASELLQ